MKSNLLIVDSTLRDGSHAMGHQFTAEHICRYSRGAEMAGIQLLIVGHGNGLKKNIPRRKRMSVFPDG